MTITCPSFERFMEVIEALTTRGLGFRADAGNLSVTLTGAH